jgi:ATP-dependent RNA helicase DHX29
MSSQLISVTSFSCRHALLVTWSKPHNVKPLELPDIQCSATTHSLEIRMVTLSTPDAQQSEAFAATAMLFVISRSSSSEFRVHYRLPAELRRVWDEFDEFTQERMNANDRMQVQQLRSLAQEVVKSVQQTCSATSRPGNSLKITDVFDSGHSHNVKKISEPGSHGKCTEDVKAIWTRKSSTVGYRKMLTARSTLPIFGFRNSILTAIAESPILILCGETGCGKSTQMPSFILEQELSQGRQCRIYCTEPRRISAITLAQRVSEELGERPQDMSDNKSLVGYSVRLETLISSQTRLIFATVGAFLRMLESKSFLDTVTHLIIDEVHERRFVVLCALKF